MSLRHYIYSLFFFILFFLPHASFAAVTDIILTPEIPGPYEPVTAEIGGYLIDIDRSEVYWYQNEQIVKQGIGEKIFEFYTKGIGEPTIIDIVIVTENGRRIDKQIVVEPIEIDLLWEAKTYTPPFYRGKALPTYNSKINFIAIPNVADPSASDFLYTWREGLFNISKKASGYKRNSFSSLAELAPYRRTVDVEAISKDRTKRAKKQVAIVSIEPELIVYEKKPLSGIDYSKVLPSSYKVTQDEIEINIEPFYFTQSDVVGENLLYRWIANGKRLKESSINANNFTFGRPASGEGYAAIEILVLNNTESLQKAKTQLSLSY